VESRDVNARARATRIKREVEEGAVKVDRAPQEDSQRSFRLRGVMACLCF
jgi:hypothetical protein